LTQDISMSMIDVSAVSHLKERYDMSNQNKLTIKQLRLKAGITAFDLAAKSDVSLSTITRMERAKDRKFSQLTVNKVLNTLSQLLKRDITIDDVSGIGVLEEEGKSK
jgi:predicted transcriptional regulator